MNSITQLLDLEDPDIFISDVSVEGTVKTITLETKILPRYCPSCGFRMHSKGIHTRKINHPILQDGYKVLLLLKQRRWKCSNVECSYTANENFRFVNKARRTTNATDMLIVEAFRDLSASASSIAKKFHTSDTHVLDVFDRYVRLDRLPLTDIISVDEVFLDMDEFGKYALVIQDFYTGDPIDILRSRRNTIVEPYFLSISKEERYAVKYLISDMYSPYLAFVEKYFPNAQSIVDSFHVIQWITHSLDVYIKQLLRNFRQRDREREDFISYEQMRPVSLPMSDEVYILSKYKWLILANNTNIRYYSDMRMDRHFHMLMNTYDYENELFRIDPKLKTLRDLKEIYVQFNERNAGKPLEAEQELAKIIHRYAFSGEKIFEDFAVLLQKYHDPIINSFIMVEKYGPGVIYDSRMSNGPIESLNRKVKDLKRLGRGFRNFDHFRNRFLYATRNNPILNATKSTDSNYYYYEED